MKKPSDVGRAEIAGYVYEVDYLYMPKDARITTHFAFDSDDISLSWALSFIEKSLGDECCVRGIKEIDCQIVNTKTLT